MSEELERCPSNEGVIMLEIRACKHCGSYPDIHIFYSGMSFYVSCPKCLKARQFQSVNQDKSQYNEVFNEIINAWNKEQEE